MNPTGRRDAARPENPLFVSGLSLPPTRRLLGSIHQLFARVGTDRKDVDGADLMLLETAVVEIARYAIAQCRPAGTIRMSLLLEVTEDALDVRLRETGQPPPMTRPDADQTQTFTRPWASRPTCSPRQG